MDIKSVNTKPLETESGELCEVVESSAYRINKSAQVDSDSIEGDDAHRLKRVAVDDVASDNSVPHLDPSSDWQPISSCIKTLPHQSTRTEKEGYLPHHPVICFVNTDTPDY